LSEHKRSKGGGKEDKSKEWKKNKINGKKERNSFESEARD
jgi:hypothetical protein